jgi:sodium/bile acid cotransporter 7
MDMKEDSKEGRGPRLVLAVKGLAKRWFLWLLVGGIATAWFFPDFLRPVSSRLGPRSLVALALFLMAWSLESKSLLDSILRPFPALWAFAISYGIVPGLAWSAGWLLPWPDLRVGLLVIASVPCTLASAVIWTRMAGGNGATALLVVMLTTGTSWLITTAWLTQASPTAVIINARGMMIDLILILIVPVGVGQLGRIFRPLRTTADRCRMPLGILSQLLILAIILKATIDLSDKINEKTVTLAWDALLLTTAICLATHLAALLGGFWSGGVFRFDRPRRIAVAFACSQKTLPVSLYLYEAYFKETHPLAIVPMVTYHVGQLIVDTFIAEKLSAISRQLSARTNAVLKAES